MRRPAPFGPAPRIVLYFWVYHCRERRKRKRLVQADSLTDAIVVALREWKVPPTKGTLFAVHSHTTVTAPRAVKIRQEVDVYCR